MNKFEAEALKRWPEHLYGRPVRGFFELGAEFGYAAGLEDAARAIEKARADGYKLFLGIWHQPNGTPFTTAQLVEKYKTE